jgi:UDP-2,3-diacylglucosamine hydrolase
VQAETVYVLADAHLGKPPEQAAAALHQFLDAVPSAGDHVVINGDLFEFWFEYGRVSPGAAFATLARLAGMRKRGVRLSVTGGNHDRWARAFWQRELDAAFYRGSAELSLAGFRAYVAHGDGVAERRLGARLLHGLTRHPVTAAAFRWIHPDIGYGLVERLSGVLGERTRTPAVLEQAAAAQRAWATALLAQRTDLDLVILGHTHRAALEPAGERRWYVNPGAWMDGFRYAVIDADGPALRSYRPQ